MMVEMVKSMEQCVVYAINYEKNKIMRKYFKPRRRPKFSAILLVYRKCIFSSLEKALLKTLLKNQEKVYSVRWF